MTTSHGELQALYVKAQEAQNLFDANMHAFNANIQRHDRAGQEQERIKMISALETWADLVMEIDFKVMGNRNVKP